MSFLDREPFASFLGRGTASITVPVLDGAFRPNDILEQARLVVELVDIDAIVAAGDRLIVSAGNAIHALEGGSTKLVAGFDYSVTALAFHQNEIFVALENGDLFVIDGSTTPRKLEHLAGRFTCPTALLVDDKEIVVAEGSSLNAPSAWSRDLLELNRSGRVVVVDRSTGASRVVAKDAAFPNGLTRDAQGEIVFSQSWRHCLSRGGDVQQRAAILSGLPGFPSRLSPSSDGGHWLCIFGMRTQLLEFVLREHKFRQRMLATVSPDYWIAPALQSREHFLDPLQGGGAKQLGIKKPWAPPRSYGLLAKLDRNFQPEWSLHSRVGGVRHGITSACEWNGDLYVVSRGSRQVIAVNHIAVAREMMQ